MAAMGTKPGFAKGDILLASCERAGSQALNAMREAEDKNRMIYIRSAQTPTGGLCVTSYKGTIQRQYSDQLEFLEH